VSQRKKISPVETRTIPPNGPLKSRSVRGDTTRRAAASRGVRSADRLLAVSRRGTTKWTRWTKRPPVAVTLSGSRRAAVLPEVLPLEFGAGSPEGLGLLG